VSDSVLLIEGDAELLCAAGDCFERIGYEVGRCGSGEAGMEAFDRLRPDVVILDLHLPDVGGLDVLARLRAGGGSVIVVTGPVDGDTAVRAMQLGAEHVLTKPLDLDHLAAATARVCEKVRLARQNTLLREALERLLPARPGAGGDRRHQPQALADVERVHIEKTLRFHGGNRTRAAQALGISRATLINKIKVYRLDA
jgi:DNA-binding NtrC family response regulator